MIGVVVGGSVLLVVVGLPSVAGAMRGLLVAGLIGPCPGWAILRHVALDPLERAVLAVAVGLALTTAVVALLMYAGWWSPERAVAVLAMLTVVTGSVERRPGAALGDRGSL
jgi:uncharacterized membrane protein